MSVGVSWIGVKGLPAQAVLEALSLRDTGRTLNDPLEARWAWGISHTGWLILHGRDLSFASPERLAIASSGGEAIGVYVDDGPLISGAFGFRDGVQIWALEHDPERGIYDLGRTGSAPPEFRSIADRLKASQDRDGGDRADVDHIFEVPIEVANAICGYRHDGQDVEPGEEPPQEPTFREMISTAVQPPPAPPKKGGGFLSRLFGGGDDG